MYVYIYIYIMCIHIIIYILLLLLLLLLLSLLGPLALSGFFRSDLDPLCLVSLHGNPSD